MTVFSQKILSFSLQRFLDLHPDAVVVANMKGETVYVNAASEHMLGISSAQIIGKNIIEVLPFPTQKYLAIDIMSRLAAEGSLTEQISFIINNRRVHGYFTCTAAIDEDGERKGIIGIFKDNTAAKNHEEMLYFLSKAGEELSASLDYQQTLKKIEQLIVPQLADWFSVELVDENGMLSPVTVKHKDPEKVEWALKMREEYPADPEGNTGSYHVLKTGVSEVYPEISDDLLVASAKDEKHLSYLREVGFRSVMIVPLKIHGESIGVIVFVSTKESNRHYSADDLELVEDFGRKVAFSVVNARLYDSINSELKERKRTEQLLELSQKYGNLASFEWDIRTKTSWHRNMSELYGVDFEEITEEKWLKLVHPEDVESLAVSFNEALKTGEYYAEFRVIPPGQQAKWILGRGRITYEDGNPVSLVGVNIDITAMKELEQKKDEFISIASHELKTPLTSVKAYVQLIERVIGPDDNHKIGEYLEKAQSYIDKLGSLISDLLNVSKIHAGKLEFKMEPFEFDPFVKETIENIQHTVDHKLIVSGSTGKTVIADRIRIEQVFFNLISNAVKYSPDADIVEINLSVKEKMLAVSVRDYGIGIPEDSLSRLFDRFYRAEQSSNQFTGLGLGLYISAEIIKRHHGRIWAERSPDGGSIFHFVLPLR